MNELIDFKFLTGDEVFGNFPLNIICEYGTKCGITDFSILLGADLSGRYEIDDVKIGKMKTGTWWTSTYLGDDYICTASRDGGNYFGSYATMRDVGARPAFSYSSMPKSLSRKIGEVNGFSEIEYGEYPQTVVNENYSSELERAFSTGNLKTTGKTYTSYNNNEYIEYEYLGNKYIRFIADDDSEIKTLSDDRKIKMGNVYWVCVEPIVWLVDEKIDLALSKYVIFSGAQFNNHLGREDNFNNTAIKKFMDKHFAKEIMPSNNIYLQDKDDVEEKKSTKKKNPYNFNFDDVSEEDIIKGAVESNVSVFLHGKSSDGKSARVKQLDPDCEILYMRNATPDSLNGKSVYNASTGEMIDIPPTWYTKVVKKCEAEPDKIHIIFFDELTNALPSIQGMAFNIVLDGEVNGKWKLPDNARIVAAGNDLNDSLAANQMAEPLFNRFAHVYINTTVDDWLAWASSPKEEYERLDYKEEKSNAKIHPAVYAYVAYKSCIGYDVLRTPYTGDKPNADPRKWEMASKVLYKTKQPEMLRALIGDELTKDFVAFTKEQVLTVEDVINHNYTDEDLRMNTSQKFATAVGLSSVDSEHFDVVREFMRHVGAEPRAAFESMWAHGDEKRLEKIAEARMTDNILQGGARR